MFSKFTRKINKLITILKPKIQLHDPTIIINKNTWAKFDRSNFRNCDFDIVDISDFRQIRKKDYNKIYAVVGGISDRKYLKSLSNLTWLQIASHGHNGYDSVDLYSNQMVTVTNAIDIYTQPIADYCISAYHLFHCYALRRQLNNKIETENVPIMKRDVNVLIYGLGNIGSEIAKNCKRIGWTVWGVKRTIPDTLPYYVDTLIDFNASIAFLPNADYVINVLPETSDTIGIFNQDFFKKMKTSALFTNVGRGSAVIDSALESAVRNHVIAGAVLDASNNYAYNDPNIIKTGHMSSVSQQNANTIDSFFTEQLMNFLEKGVDGLKCSIKMK